VNDAHAEEHLENGRTNLSDATHVALIRESSEGCQPELVDPIRMFIIKVGVKHPGQTEGLTDDVVKVRERR
jgi:hypothetical protein